MFYDERLSSNRQDSRKQSPISKSFFAVVNLPWIEADMIHNSSQSSIPRVRKGFDAFAALFHQCSACRRRKQLGWLGATAALLMAILFLSSPPPVKAQAQEKPLQIGVLALGPRKVPTWRCGPETFQLASTEP